MDSKTKLAGILLAGYLLGRTKKMRLALTVAGAISGRHVVAHRSDLLGQASKVLDSSPEVKRLAGQVTGTLMTAARGAAVAAAAKGVNSLSENLTERAEKLRAPKQAGEAASAAADTAGKAASTAGETAGEAVSTVGDTASSAVGDVASTVTSPLGKKSRKRRDKGEEAEEPEDQGEAEEPEDEAEEPEDEAEEPEREEPEDEGEELEEPEDEAEEPEDEAEEPEEPEDEAQEPEEEEPEEEEPEEEEPEEEEPAQRSKMAPATPRPAGRPRSEGTRNKSGSQPRRAPRQGTAGRSKAE